MVTAAGYRKLPVSLRTIRRLVGAPPSGFGEDGPADMAREPIPREVRTLVTAHLHSISQLDVLLFLVEHAGTEHTAAGVAQALRAPERLVAGSLADFATAGLVALAGGEGPAYRFDPGAPRGADVETLAACVRHRRRAVHDLILGGPSTDVQTFSDAFRLRKDD